MLKHPAKKTVTKPSNEVEAEAEAVVENKVKVKVHKHLFLLYKRIQLL